MIVLARNLRQPNMMRLSEILFFAQPFAAVQKKKKKACLAQVVEKGVGTARAASVIRTRENRN